MKCSNCHQENRKTAKFCENCGHKLDNVEKTSNAASSSSPLLSKFIPQELAAQIESARTTQAIQGERRVVTILFCDVKGSTAAAEQLDPEDWTEIMNGAFERLIRPVYQYEGTVARLMGDAILAFFGAPTAHEDDPQRGILAGLEIVSSIQPYRNQIQTEWGIDFDVRVGINTGLVVVGAVGSDLRLEYTAMGDAINLAARMEQTAVPGTVQISEETYKLVSPLFEFETLGMIEIKGKAEPVKTYRPLKRKTSPGRVRGIEELDTPLVGREYEFGIFEDLMINLGKGDGGLLFLIGEAGLGKSRLLQEIKLYNDAHTNYRWFETHSLSYETEQPYGLIRRLMRRVISVSAEDEPESMHAKISSAVEVFPSLERTQARRVFETLFGLVSRENEPALEGETFKGLLYSVMHFWWHHWAETGPIVLVCDDVHWSDPASIALLQHLFHFVDQTAFLMVFSMRTDQETPSWQAMHAAAKDFPLRYNDIRLQNLNTSESGKLVESLLNISDLPVDLRTLVMEKSDGNPFFIEEVVRTLIDQGLIVRNENNTHWQAIGDWSDFNIPGNLKTLLVARMDRLAEDPRRTLQVASIVGRSFYYRVLQHLVNITSEALEQHMQTLQHTQLIQEVARLPELEYIFRHALTQEAVYSTILLKQRRAYHRQVGEALELLFPDRLDELAPQLAFHFSESRQAEKAFNYYIMAGDIALRLFAINEALSNYDQAMNWTEPGGATDQQLIHLYRQRGRVLELLLRHDEALENYQALETLGKTHSDDSLRLAGISSQALEYAFGHSEYEKGRQRAEEALALAQQLGDRYTEARSLWTLLLSYTWDDSIRSLAYGEHGLRIARELVSSPQPSNEYLELLALLLVDLTLPLSATGQIEAAREYAIEAKKLFENLGNMPMASTAGQRLGIAYKMGGQFEQSEIVTDQSMAIDRSMGNNGGVIGGALGLLDLYLETGDYDKFLTLLDEITPIVVREGRMPIKIFELYPVAVYSHLGAVEQVQQMIAPLLQFLETEKGLWSAIFLGDAVYTLIQAGQLYTAQELLDKVEMDFDTKNYLIPLSPQLPQIQAEIALATGALDEALAKVDDFLAGIRKTEVLRYRPKKLLLKGKILLKANRSEEAYAVLKAAHILAMEQNARPSLWQICFHLAEIEADNGNLSKAQSLRIQARTAIDYITKHAGRDDLRSSFLALPEIQIILSTTGDNYVKLS